MANRKNSTIRIAIILVVLLLFSVPAFAQQVLTYVGHIGPFDPYTPNNLVAHVMFTDSGVIVEQGGISKSFILSSTINSLEFYVSSEKGDGCSVSISKDRTFMALFILSTNYTFELVGSDPNSSFNSGNNSSNPNNNSNNNDTKKTPKPCMVCHGTGSCSVCKGTGIYEMFGNSTECSACGGTGKCWHCNGTRYEP